MELRARIGAHLRREKREHVARLALGRICFMLEARKMMIDEKEISLTKAEYEAYAKEILRQTSYYSLIGGYKDIFKNPTTKKYKLEKDN